MDTTHNEFNKAISDMEFNVRKGQPFAKHNKYRQVRATLRDMRQQQAITPTARDIWGYVKMWLINTIKRLNRRL